LEKLAEIYSVSEEVEPFLSSYSFLFQPLFQAIEPIRNSFGKRAKPRLEVLEEGSTGQLFVVIRTKLEPKKAATKLAKFDKEWWFNVPQEIHDYLEFTLEFVG
jgi:hypothetical protein